MINPDENEFMEDEPLSSRQVSDNEDLPSAGERISRAAAETWENTKTKAVAARDRTEYLVRQNPIPTIVGALALGLAVGWALRHATERDDEEIEIKSPLGSLNWSFLSLPFLWPFFKSVRERYEDSSDAIRDQVDRLKKVDVDRYTKPIRKRWKAWID